MRCIGYIATCLHASIYFVSMRKWKLFPSIVIESDIPNEKKKVLKEGSGKADALSFTKMRFHVLLKSTLKKVEHCWYQWGSLPWNIEYMLADMHQNYYSNTPHTHPHPHPHQRSVDTRSARMRVDQSHWRSSGGGGGGRGATGKNKGLVYASR